MPGNRLTGLRVDGIVAHAHRRLLLLGGVVMLVAVLTLGVAGGWAMAGKASGDMTTGGDAVVASDDGGPPDQHTEDRRTVQPR